MSTLMNTLLFGFGISAYVAAHAYTVLVLKARVHRDRLEPALKGS
jgi:hypothetical protein